ncbi:MULTISPECIES: DNA mismatch repair endonuclease MutL [unclassified Salinivibrio]|uniref:DNA mismatch repair endonuclease MutL n=1 Tax=unclassified Salinivibrio TaxID=2636825 RepID=UPI00128E5E71|nr:MULTISPECIES: DNA mismatch repair endonuclease MutL [unclassified Salinivibrio]MPS32874.1 DNA mismatch repair endonuclease MutL [Salinivibrio sp. VYel7]MPX94262.1 DNA mismatch repair endonuclease MutL [Salinivibrio sp. VYel9]MPY00548.1 DNA mismatch repair endonuclease MutL [Salinivibrio sp. VYel4]MPY03449.1 DNA mismatch repair endonuclease MutL [Salinivibrio sp. VYel5]MPY06429.1 DNA mismatch repair endonuclease MutL [Salinivibrio sp. VYel8]
MAIEILPARLANQIAAGEVVERPASVVKELVENSIDAGATRIDVDIEKGGSKLIRVRDNGCGISKADLQLALSRHATSKIHSLDDLEAIMSLGFRGEALASVSSVSRLTITSRPADQQEAWSAFAEGREMAVNVKPAAHPVGCTVEVVDLFFNTPARRKFLRTEKTEFGHIDELLRRIALSRFDITINLRHNGTQVRQYRRVPENGDPLRRVKAICGQKFVEHALRIDLHHHDMALTGWICTPEGARQQSDMQHCFVNQRMMKDKLINHAIRQGYEQSLARDQYAAFVLYIDVDPHQVDVNVHPAKHEVRFHQARLVHDFIYQAIYDGLQQASLPEDHSVNPETGEVREAVTYQPRASATANPNPYQQAVDAFPDYPGKRQEDGASPASWSRDTAYKHHADDGPTRGRPSHGSDWPGRADAPSRSPSKQATQAYQALMTPQPDAGADLGDATPTRATSLSPFDSVPAALDTVSTTTSTGQPGLGKVLSVVEQHYVLMAWGERLWLADHHRLECWRHQGVLQPALGEGLVTQPLLIPQRLSASTEECQRVIQYQALLGQFGIHIRPKGQQLMVMSVCQPLRQHNLQAFIPALLAFLAQLDPEQSHMDHSASMCCWLAKQLTVASDPVSLAQAVQTVSDVEQYWQGDALEKGRQRYFKRIDLTSVIEALQHD